MITLLECVLAQSLAMQCELLHVFRDRFAQILVDIEFGQILSEHESMSTQTCEQTDLWIDDVSWLDVVSRPDGMESDLRQIRYPLCEHLAHHLAECLAVVLEVLSCLVGVAVGRCAADDLPGVQELLAIDCVESLVVSSVDDHVERVAPHTQVGQPACDERLVLDGIELCVDSQHVSKLLRPPSHGVDKVVACELDIVLVVSSDEDAVFVLDALHVQDLAVLKHLSTMLLADGADILDGSSRCCLPAVFGDECVTVDVVVGVPIWRDDLGEVLSVDHACLAPCS